MSNMSIRGVTCPTCGGAVSVRASGYGGSSPSFDYPGDGPDIELVDSIEFEECEHDLAFSEYEGVRAEDPASVEFWAEVDKRIDAGEIEVDEYEPPEPDDSDWDRAYDSNGDLW